MYLFPRDCPRILLWPKPDTTDEDRARWFGERSCRMIAYIEDAWRERVHSGFILRYEFAEAGFENLGDAGMWVSRCAAVPIAVTRFDDLPGELEAQNVELVSLDSLLPLKNVWSTTLHASGLRLRGAKGWDQNWP